MKNIEVPDYKPYSIEDKNKVFEQQFKYIQTYITNFNTCIDIGAHVGIYAINYSRIFNNVYSFEPVPSLYKMLEHNTQDYSNIQVYNSAASDHKGKVVMFENQHNSEINAIVHQETLSVIGEMKRKALDRNLTPPKEISVNAIRIDEFDFSDVGFIKIDTENYVFPVLEGLNETIDRCRPVIQLECPERYRNPIYKYFDDIGYEMRMKLEEDVVMVSCAD